MINGTIYIHSNKETGKVYVGQTLKTVKDRWKAKADSYKTSSFFNSAIKKYGWDSFDHQVVVENVKTQEELDNLEKLWILCLQATNSEFGYNLETGGGNGKPNAEARKRMSEGQKRIGNKPPNATGRVLSEETKELMRIARKKHGFTQEHRDKITASLIGRKLTPEHVANMKAAPHLPCTEETKEKLRAKALLRPPDYYDKALEGARLARERKKLAQVMIL